MIFFMMICAITGLHLFAGVLKNRCLDPLTGSLTDSLCGGSTICEGGMICCKAIGNLVLINNFDNIGWSFYNIFQVITM